MKTLLAVLKKNFKLLFRNKEAVYTIIFGPILIVLLVGFAFMGKSDYAMKVGIYSDSVASGQQNEMYDQTVALLSQKGYSTTIFDNESACAKNIQDSIVNACIAFNNKQVTIYLDASRMNLVYKISEDLSLVINIQRDAIRQALATDAIVRIDTAKSNLDNDILLMDSVHQRLVSIKSNLTLARNALSEIKNDSVNISLAGLYGHQLGLAQEVDTAASMSRKAITESIDMIYLLESDCSSCDNKTLNEAYQLQSDLKDVSLNITLLSQEGAQEHLLQSKFILDSAVVDIENLTQRFENETVARRAITASIKISADQADTVNEDFNKVEENLQATRLLLGQTKANASTIASPVQVQIQSVVANEDKIAFTFPYLFILVMMFMGLLLASTLVVTDKMSKASFRNFTTPVGDLFHLLASFITAFTVLVIEAAIVLLVSTVFVAQHLVLDTPSTLFIIAVSIVVFSFIGMVIGSFAKTQEAAMIASISVGSILLFVSNVIAPIEGMMKFVQLIAKLNPYLTLSELLKRSMLFGITFNQVINELLIVFILTAFLFILLIFIQRRARSRYFRQDDGILAQHIPAPLEMCGKYITNPVELLDALDRMTRAEFESIVKTDENAVSVWVQKELREKGLAKKLRTTSKEKMILQIDEHLKKHGKELKR